jgi:hypothetical protein
MNVISTEGMAMANIDQSLNDSKAFNPSTEKQTKDHLNSKNVPNCFPDSPTVEGLVR